MARPDLWRVERCRPSNATSSTSPWSGSCTTSRTGPKRSIVLRRTIAVDLQQLLVGEAEIGLADRHQLVAVLAARPDPEGVIGIIRRALAAAALRIHQHRIDRERIALPFPPQALRPAGHVGRVAALEHDAFDRVGILAGAGRGGIGARRDQLRPRCRTATSGEMIDARIVEPRDEGFEPRAPLGERQFAQVLVAVDQKIVGAQMRGKFGDAASA